MAKDDCIMHLNVKFFDEVQRMDQNQTFFTHILDDSQFRGVIRISAGCGFMILSRY